MSAMGEPVGKAGTRSDGSRGEVSKVEESRGEVKFSSTLSSYVTLLGYSLGFSDFWRFPFLAYRNGGGAFLIPFIVAMFACGIPLYFLEYSISKFSGKGPYKIWDICPLFRGTTHAVLVANALYMLGATAMRFWIAELLLNSFTDPLPWTTCDNPWNTPDCVTQALVKNASNVVGDLAASGVNGNGSGSGNGVARAQLGTSTSSILLTTFSGAGSQRNMTGNETTSAEEFWLHQAVRLSPGMSDLAPFIWKYVIVLVIWRLLVSLFVVRSVKSIEKVMYVTTIVPFLLTVAIFVRSLTLPGATEGLYFFIYPQFDKIMDTKVWVEAALMAFYTLGPGWGVILVLGSHTQFRENCYRTSTLLPLLDGVVAIFYSMICFSVLGNTAAAYDVDVQNVVNTGQSTGIVAYTSALAVLPLPQLWSVLFFASVLLSGFDSQMVTLELMIQIIGDAYPRLYPRYRLHTIAVMTIVMSLVSLPLCTGAGGYIFAWLDWYSGAWIGPVVAFIEVFVVAWLYGMDRFADDVQLMTGIKMPAVFRIAIAYVAPILVLVMFVSSCTNYIPMVYGTYSYEVWARTLGWCIVLQVMFISSCTNYVPPKYGDYSYPVWARTLGWIIVAVVMAPMPLLAVRALARDRGSVTQRLRNQSRPTAAWGPCDLTAEIGYQQNKYTRGWFHVFWFNLTGKYSGSVPAVTPMSNGEQMKEMSHM